MSNGCVVLRGGLLLEVCVPGEVVVEEIHCLVVHGEIQPVHTAHYPRLQYAFITCKSTNTEHYSSPVKRKRIAILGVYPPLYTYPPSPTPKRVSGPEISTLTWTDIHLWKHYLPATSLTGGNQKVFQLDAYHPLAHHTCFSIHPPDVCTSGVGRPQMNKFEQVSGLGHQMSLGDGSPQVNKSEQVSSLCHQTTTRGPYVLRSNAWVMVIWDAPPAHKQTPVKILPSRNFVRGR